MPNYSYPGVYVEEVAGGARPIDSAGTSTAAFVGLAERGPDDQAVRVTSWDDYVRRFGGFVRGGYLAQSVWAFFNNGGRQCYIVRVTPSDAAAAEATLVNRAGTPTAGVRFIARDKGAWGNALLLSISDGTNDPGNEFRLTIRPQPDPRVVPKPDELKKLAPLEVHDNLSMDPDAPNAFDKVLKRNSKLLDAQRAEANVAIQKGLHRGGEPAMTPSASSPQAVPVIKAGCNRFDIAVDGDLWQTVEIPLPAAATPYTWDTLAAAITTAVNALTPRKASVQAAAYSGFSCTAPERNVDASGNVKVRWLELRSGVAHGGASVRVRNAGEASVAALLRIGDGNGGISTGGRALQRPALADDATVVQLGDTSDGGVVQSHREGNDGTLPADGTSAEKIYTAGFKLLDRINDVSLLAVPGLGTASIVDKGIAYCETRPLQDLFFIGEVGPSVQDASSAAEFRTTLTGPSSYGALYTPWVRASDPSGASATPVLLPPSGFVAGLYARTDGTRGVWKAPAGTDARILGVLSLAGELTDTEQGNLNPIGVNVIRRFSLSGIVSWGSRTLAGADSEYRYVPVRRTAIMLRRSIYDGIQWAVFEPNDERLWAALRLNIGAFMNGLFRAGAFQGSKASDAYFVRCGLGDNTMTQDDIDRGQVVVLVGFAPVKPAEFVIVRVQQMLGQS